MVVFELTDLDGKKVPFNIPENLTEITVAQFVKFHETVIQKKPKNLAEYEKLTEKEEKEKFMLEIEVDEIVSKWNDYYVNSIQFWTEMSDEHAGQLTREQVSWIYNLIQLNISSHKADEKKTQFTHKKETYYFPPAPLSELSGGQKSYMKGSRVIDIIEAFQFDKFSKALSKSDWGALPYLLAILCKKKDEQLPIKSEKREFWIVNRKNIMDTLPLSEAFDLAFFLTVQKSILEKYSSLFSLLQIKKHLISQSTFGTRMVGTSP